MQNLQVRNKGITPVNVATIHHVIYIKSFPETYLQEDDNLKPEKWMPSMVNGHNSDILMQHDQNLKDMYLDPYLADYQGKLIDMVKREANICPTTGGPIQEYLMNSDEYTLIRPQCSYHYDQQDKK